LRLVSPAVNDVEKKVRLSQIFKWYRQDFGSFEAVLRSIISFLEEETRMKVTAFLDTQDFSFELEYEPYDWSLNGDAPCSDE
jgi:hypothetical protein